MAQTTLTGVDGVRAALGTELGTSDWLTITQERVDQFAEATDDRQWIHVDPERARRESPLGTTIAHGFLTLSLLSSLIEECIEFPTARMAFNYGFDRVRFVAPVAVGAQIRGTFVLDDVREIENGADMNWRVEVEIRDEPKPALAAIWLTRVIFAPESGGAVQ